MEENEDYSENDLEQMKNGADYQDKNLRVLQLDVYIICHNPRNVQNSADYQKMI